MNTGDYPAVRENVVAEIAKTLAAVSPDEVEKLRDAICRADKVFVIGVGRTFLMMKAFAKRLKHLGIDSYVVGETTEPPLQRGDLLVAGSASGKTLLTLNTAKTAKNLGGLVAVVTAAPESPLAELADLRVHIPAPSSLQGKTGSASKQPLGNLFEQSLLLFNDIVCILVRENLNISEAEMRQRHANLE